MKLSVSAKKIFASLISSLSLVRLFIQSKKRTGFVALTYHRILPVVERHGFIHPGLYVQPHTLRMHIQFIVKYFSIVPISRLIEGHSNRTDNKPWCILTFDDGWLDFYSHAFPILLKHQIPATVFLPTSLIGTNQWLWTDRLAFILFHVNKNTQIGQRPKTCSHPLARKILEVIERKGLWETLIDAATTMLKKHLTNEIEEALEELSSIYGEPLLPKERAFLTWEEVEKLANSSIITFGSHTANHRILTTLNLNEAKDELEQSRHALIKKGAADESFIPFSYPNGDYNAELARITAKAGYSLAVTTNRGWNMRHCDLFSLKRIPIHQDMTETSAMLGCRITGFV